MIVRYGDYNPVWKGGYGLNDNLNKYKELFSCIFDGAMLWNIAIYVRLSKDDGNSVSLSIVNQIKKISRYLKNFKDFIIYDIYIDDGLTGTDFDRNDYIRLQNDVDNKLVNCIIVKDLTRYSRNIADGIKQLDNYVLEKNIRFISVGIPEIDTYLQPTSISSSEVYQALQNAEDFARITSKKVRDIKEIKRFDGEKNGGFPPYGYLPNPSGEHWLPDPGAQEIVKRMFLWSMAGVSDTQVAKKLNDLNIPNPTLYKQQVLGLKYQNPQAHKNSGLWWPATVHRILADKTYLGCSVQGKSSSFDHKRHKQIPKRKEEYVVVPNAHESTIDSAIFEKVNDIRKQRMRSTKNSGKVHIFANLVYCADCKRAMKKTSARGYSYLVCRTYRDMGSDYCTYKRSINFDLLEEVILNVIQYQIKLIADFQLIIDKMNRQPVINNRSVRLKGLIEYTKKEILKVEHIIDSSYYDWKNDDISKEQYQRIRSEMNKKSEQLKCNLQGLLEKEKLLQDTNLNDEFLGNVLNNKNIVSLDRLVVLELINKIYINDDKSIRIEFNYEDQYLMILDSDFG